MVSIHQSSDNQCLIVQVIHANLEGSERPFKQSVIVKMRTGGTLYYNDILKG